jgi:cytochrome c oxidase accessory protein FixG
VVDKNTLIVNDDAARGEPRGARSRKADPGTLALGSCVSCNLCVHVCPTGIDIRNGLQYECIGCAGCIDVCNSVMDRMNYPRGLIRFTTQHAMAKRWTRPQVVRHVLRPRVLVYGTVLLSLCFALAFSLAVRTPLKVDVVRDRASLARIVAGGRLEDVYRLQIMNATEQQQRYRIEAEGLAGLTLASDAEVAVGAAESRWVAVRLQIPYGSASPGSHPIHFEVHSLADHSEVKEKAAFLVPR